MDVRQWRGSGRGATGAGRVSQSSSDDLPYPRWEGSSRGCVSRWRVTSPGPGRVGILVNQEARLDLRVVEASERRQRFADRPAALGGIRALREPAVSVAGQFERARRVRGAQVPNRRHQRALRNSRGWSGRRRGMCCHHGRRGGDRRRRADRHRHRRGRRFRRALRRFARVLGDDGRPDGGVAPAPPPHRGTAHPAQQ